MIGACDVCNKQDVEVSFALCAGIETYACDECCECCDPKQAAPTPAPWIESTTLTGYTHVRYGPIGIAWVDFEKREDFDFFLRAVNAHDELAKSLTLGEEVAALTISFIEKACGQTADWLDAGNVLNDKILEFRRARASALAKTEKV